MKKLLLVIAILTTNYLFSQDFDKMMTTKQVDCPDISQNSGLYLIHYLQEAKIDSAKSLLSYWEEKCGEREPIFRAKILLALIEGNYSDSLITERTINYIYNYRSRLDIIRSSNYHFYDYNKSYYGFIPPNQEFDRIAQKIAKTLKSKYSEDSMEYLLAELYSEETDTLLYKIQSESYKNSRLRKEYDKEVAKYTKQGEFHMAWITGLWIPTGDLTTLGIHPDLGFQMGAKQGKMNYDFTMMFKFLESKNSYIAYRDDNPELTKEFFGGYIGIDIGRDIFVKNGHEFQLTGGIAIDGFDALQKDEELDLDSESAWSYNFNLGLGYRYYITNSFYLGLKAKYNIVDYSLNGVTDLTGHPITIQFTIGSVSNIFRNNNLKDLGYKLRK